MKGREGERRWSKSTTLDALITALARLSSWRTVIDESSLSRRVHDEPWLTKSSLSRRVSGGSEIETKFDLFPLRLPHRLQWCGSAILSAPLSVALTLRRTCVSQKPVYSVHMLVYRVSGHEDYRSCPGSHAVGPRHASRQRLTKPKFRQRPDGARGRAGYATRLTATANRPPPPGGVSC